MLLAIVGVWQRVQRPWWDMAADVQQMNADIRSDDGYESVYEYVPAGADSERVDQNADEAALAGGAGQVDVEKWGPELKTITVAASAPSQVRLRLFNYPAWQVTVHGARVAAISDRATGQMLIPVPAGNSTVRVALARTPDRTLGGIISMVAVVLVAVLFWWAKRDYPITRQPDIQMSRST